MRTCHTLITPCESVQSMFEFESLGVLPLLLLVLLPLPPFTGGVGM